MNEWRELKTMLKALGDIVSITIVYHLVGVDKQRNNLLLVAQKHENRGKKNYRAK